MPRRLLSKEGSILQFFQTAPLGMAQLVYSLVGDLLHTRKEQEDPHPMPPSAPVTQAVPTSTSAPKAASTPKGKTASRHLSKPITRRAAAQHDRRVREQAEAEAKRERQREKKRRQRAARKARLAAEADVEIGIDTRSTDEILEDVQL